MIFTRLGRDAARPFNTDGPVVDAFVDGRSSSKSQSGNVRGDDLEILSLELRGRLSSSF
jgi:hypothetical protein